jgi:hypothetical protein
VALEDTEREKSMRFLASWWERVPVREAAPTLTAMFVAAGAFGFGCDFIQRVLGFVWG